MKKPLTAIILLSFSALALAKQGGCNEPDQAAAACNREWRLSNHKGAYPGNLGECLQYLDGLNGGPRSNPYRSRSAWCNYSEEDLHPEPETKAKNDCKSPPSFKVKTEVEGEPVPYCMVHVSSDSPYPLSCRITNAGYNMMIYPGQSKFYGWPMGGNDQCYGNVDCKRPIDYSTNKPVKYGECQ